MSPAMKAWCPSCKTESEIKVTAAVSLSAEVRVSVDSLRVEGGRLRLNDDGYESAIADATEDADGEVDEPEVRCGSCSHYFNGDEAIQAVSQVLPAGASLVEAEVGDIVDTDQLVRRTVVEADLDAGWWRDEHGETWAAKAITRRAPWAVA